MTSLSLSDLAANDRGRNVVADGGYIIETEAADGRDRGRREHEVGREPGFEGVTPAGLPDAMDAGIYFGLPEDHYHAAHALSASGIKWLRVSPLDFWARSSMNPDREPDGEDSFAKLVGKAYHKRIAEGRDAFTALYAPALDERDYPNAIHTIDDIKEALGNVGVKPKGKVKADFIAQLAAADPGVRVWDDLVEHHAFQHQGKTLLPADLIRRIEVSAAMIEKHPQLGKAFTGGYPEVSIFWTDPEYGVPMKARLDYLKRAAVVDLKTFENMNGMPIDKAIARTIASYKYHIQARHYLDAVQEAKRLIRDGRVFGEVDPAFLDALAKSDGHTFMFVFQQKGVAPIARGVILPSLTLDLGRMEIDNAKRSYADCRDRFGADPWVDAGDIREFDSTEFPAYLAD